jgi:hypothetical protein
MHRAEQILSTLQQILKDSTFVTVVDSSIVRDRVDPAKVAPDISVNMGADDVFEDGNMAFIDSTLNVNISVTVKNTSGLSSELNIIRRQIHRAIYTDTNIGLSFVILGKYTGAGAITVSDNLEQAVAQQIINYEFDYRHSINDPGL